MKKLTLLLVLLVLVLIAGLSSAAGQAEGSKSSAAIVTSPANDDFVSATVLASDDGSLIGESNVDATSEASEPSHDGLTFTPTHSVWYQWTPTASAIAVIEIVVPYSGSWDPVLAVYTGSTVAALTEVAATHTTGYRATLKFRADAGTTYHLAVDGYDSTESGTFDLIWSIPAPNDDFASATVLGTDSGSLIGESNDEATAETGEPNHNGVTPSRSVWYQWTPVVDGNAVVQATTHPYSTWNIVLGVYTGSTVDTLAEVIAGGGPMSVGLEVEFRVEAGVTYYLAIDGRTSQETGSFDLTWSIPSPANDDFANATVLSADSGWLLGESNEWATAEPGEPAHNGLAGTPARSVWYQWTADADGVGVITGDTRRYSSFTDVVMAAYTGAAVDALTEIAAWGSNGTRHVRLEFAVIAGTTYHIVLDGYDEDEMSSFDLTWALSPPANDDFSDAIALAERNGTLVGESTEGATPQIGEPTHGAVAGTPARSVWYEWTPIWDGDATVDVNTPSDLDNWDSVLAVYTGSSLSALTEVAAASVVGTNLHLEFGVTAGTTYRLVVDGHDSDNWGSFDLAWAYHPYGDTFHVTKTEDTDDGACDADCSLREAVGATNQTGGNDTIHLPSGTYTLTHPSKGLYFERETGTTSILGAGRDVTIIDAAGLEALPGGVYARSRIFGLDYHAGLTLVGVTLTGGYTAVGDKDGGAIASWNGYLTVIDCLIEGNVSGEDGGGIANLYGTAVISNTVVRDNNTDPPEYTTTGGGGGIFNSGTMTITGSLIENNESDWGGGIASQWTLLEEYVPSLTIVDSTISENRARHGAGIANTEMMPDVPGREAMLNIADSQIVNNHADRNQYGVGAFNEGGGIYNGGYSAAAIIDNTIISGNLVTAMHALHPKDGGGGGLQNHAGRVEIRDSTISDNDAICDQVVHGDPDLCGRGGGIVNTGAGRLVVLNSTISGNETALLNSDHGAYLGGGGGGGLAHMPHCNPPYCWCPTTTIINTTITGNTADHGGAIDTRWESWGGGLYDVPEWRVEPGSNIYECPGLSVMNSVFAENDATFTTETEDCWGEYLSFGHNLVGKSTGCPAGGSDDITTVDPLLGPLAYNGGDTKTHAPLAGSPAIDAGDPAGCSDHLGAPITMDQRSYPRPLDGNGDGDAICDIGSVEYLLILVPLTGVTLDGPVSGDVGAGYSFTATAGPITATLPISYSWTADGQAPMGHAGGVTDTVLLTWDVSGDYTITVTATNSFSTVTDTLVITIAELPISGLVANNDGPTVLGNATNLSAVLSSGSNVSYVWDFGDKQTGSGQAPSHVYSAPGSYTAVVTATNAAGQQAATTSIRVDEAIAGLAAANDGPTILGNVTHLTAAVTTGSTISYVWDFGDEQAGSGKTPSHTYGAPGSYTAVVTATNAVGQQVATTSIQVDEAVTGLAAANDGPIILGIATHLTATVVTGSNVSYFWDFGDEQTSSSRTPSHTYDAPGSYTVVVTATNAVGRQVATTTVRVEEAISGLTAINSGLTVLGTSTRFTATVATGSSVSYTWDFGDEETGSGNSIDHIYAAPGIYTATVTATNAVSEMIMLTRVSVYEVNSLIYLPVIIRP